MMNDDDGTKDVDEVDDKNASANTILSQKFFMICQG